MIIKIIKLAIIILILTIITAFILIKNPKYIEYIVNTNTSYQITINDIYFSKNNKQISLNSNNITLKNQNSTTSINDIKIIFNFYNIISPEIKVVIKQLNTKINNPITKNNNKNKLTIPKFFQLKINKLLIDYNNLKIKTSFEIQNINKKQIFSGLIKEFNIKKNLPYLHLILHKETREYLQSSLKQGLLSNINFTAAIHKNKKFSLYIDGKIINGAIKYRPNWQIVNNINADFYIDNKQLTLQIKSATTDSLIANGAVIVRWATNPVVKVDVATKSSSQNAIKFLINSPLKLNELKSFQVSGKANTEVDLTIPLDDKPIQIKISADLLNNQFLALKKKLSIKNINAKLTYDDKLSINGQGFILDKKRNIDLSFDKILQFRVYDKTNNINFTNTNKLWLIEILNKNITGEIKIDLSKKTPLIHLENFNIKNNINSNEGGTNNINIKPTDIIDFDLTTNNITINKYLLPDIKTSFIRKENTLHIKNLQLEGIQLKQQNININGAWVNGVTTLWSNLKSDKLKDLFDSFNINEKTKGGKFNLDLRVFCQCNPWEITISKLSGYSSLNIKDGIFTEQSPNLGRVLSLLNINALTQRLSLKNEDVIGKGFSYNSVQSEIIFNKGGVAMIDNFVLESTSSKINLIGSGNIIDKTYNLNAEVIPAIKDGIPIITALAGGGIAGLGIWLIDKAIFKEKLLNSIIGKITIFNYKITGSWDKPIIK